MHSTLQFYRQFCLTVSIHNLVLKQGFLKTFNSQTHSEKNALALLQIVVQKTLLHEVSQTLNPEDTYYPCKRVKREHPVILPNKDQPLTLI